MRRIKLTKLMLTPLTVMWHYAAVLVLGNCVPLMVLPSQPVRVRAMLKSSKSKTVNGSVS